MSYEEPCGIARALDIVGQRWALLVVRELLYGPKRFTDLRASLPTASQNVLTQRLRELTDNGLLRRRKLGPPANTWVYELTDRGLALEPVLIELGRWGSLTPLVSTADMSVFAFVLALKTTFRPDLAQDLNARYELRLDDDCFEAIVADGEVTFTRGPATEPDSVIETSVRDLRTVVFGGADITAGQARITGSADLAARFTRLFPRPS